jgi:hypothetical protein
MLTFLGDKKGTDKMLSIYWFAILFIVAAAIVYIASLFYGKPYDVREIEANLLANKISDCLVDSQGYFFGAGGGDVMRVCNFNFNVEDEFEWKSNQYYIEVSFTDSNEKISVGNAALAEQCSKKLDKNPFCIERSVYFVDSSNNQRFAEILSVVRKTEKNV